MSNSDIQGGEHLKPETEEVLKELQAEGYEIEGMTSKQPEEPPKEPAPSQKPAGEEQPKPEGDKPAEGQKPKEGDQPKDDTKPQGEPEKGKPKERDVRAVPVQKFNELRHKLQESNKTIEALQKQIADLSQKPQGSASEAKATDIAKQYAEKLGLDESYVATLAEMVKAVAGQGAQIPAEVAEKLREIDKFKEIATQAEEEKAFEADFSQVAEDLKKDGIDITGHKDALKQLAYTEGYTSTPLRTVAIAYAHDQGLLAKGKKTLEKGPAGRTGGAEAVDFDNLTEEQVKNLSDDEFEKWTEHQIKKQQQAQGIKRTN